VPHRPRVSVLDQRTLEHAATLYEDDIRILQHLMARRASPTVCGMTSMAEFGEMRSEKRLRAAAEVRS